MKKVNLNSTPTEVQKTNTQLNNANSSPNLPGSHVSNFIKKTPTPSSENSIYENEANVAQIIVAPNDKHLEEYNKFLNQQKNTGGAIRVVQDFFSALNLPTSLIEGGIGATFRAINGHDKNAGGFFSDLWNKGVASQFTNHPYMGTNMIEDVANNPHLFDKTSFWGKLGISIGVDFVVSLPLTILSGAANLWATAGEAAEKTFAKTSEELASHAVGDIAEKDLSEGAQEMLKNLRRTGKNGLYEPTKNKVEQISKNIANSSEVSYDTKKAIVKGFLKKSLREDSGHEELLKSLKTKIAIGHAIQFAINPSLTKAAKFFFKKIFALAKEGKFVTKDVSDAYVNSYVKNANFMNNVANKLSFNRGLSIENKRLIQKTGKFQSDAINDIKNRVFAFKSGVRDLSRRIVSKNATSEERDLFKNIVKLHKKISNKEGIDNIDQIEEIEKRVLSGKGTKVDKATIHNWFHSAMSYSTTNPKGLYHLWKGKNGDSILNKLSRNTKNHTILPGYDGETFSDLNDFLKNILGSNKDYIEKINDGRVEIVLTDGDINRLKVLDKNKDKIHLNIAHQKVLNKIISTTEKSNLKTLANDAYHAGFKEKNKFLPPTTNAHKLFYKFSNTPFEKVMSDKKNVFEINDDIARLKEDLEKLPKEEVKATKKVISTKNVSSIDKEINDLKKELENNAFSPREKMAFWSEIKRLQGSKETVKPIKKVSKTSKRETITNSIAKKENQLKEFTKKYHYGNTKNLLSHIDEDSEKYSKVYQGLLGRHHLAQQLDKKIVLGNDKDINDILKPIEKNNSYKKIAGDAMNMYKTHYNLFVNLLKRDGDVYHMEKNTSDSLLEEKV